MTINSDLRALTASEKFHDALKDLMAFSRDSLTKYGDVPIEMIWRLEDLTALVERMHDNVCAAYIQADLKPPERLDDPVYNQDAPVAPIQTTESGEILRARRKQGRGMLKDGESDSILCGPCIDAGYTTLWHLEAGLGWDTIALTCRYSHTTIIVKRGG